MGIPALLMTKVNGKKTWDITGRTAPNWRGKNFSLSVIGGITSIPVVAVMTQIMRSTQPQGQVGKVLQELDAARTVLFENMLHMDSPLELSWVFVLLAVLPAFFEEYLFRGIILGIGKKEFQKRWVSVVFQALVFALLHFSYFELPGIFFMGFVFGLIALRNGHIWFGVVAHMVFNGTTVAVQYFMKNASQPEYDKIDQLIANFTIATPAAILLGMALYQLTRKSNNHETQ
jgi:membrane protease YdiL (CAAX protease family)